jgi:hypothetical protein
MTVGQLVADTLALKRVAECDHNWAPYDLGEDRCSRCHVVATELGKQHLAKLKARFQK